jgi:hypothetical protein
LAAPSTSSKASPRRAVRSVHRAPTVDLGHHVERLAQHRCRFIGGNQLSVRDIGAFESPYQPDLSPQSIESSGIGAGTGHPKHHPVITPSDADQRVLRPAGQDLETRALAVSGRLLFVEPMPQRVCVDPGDTDRNLSHGYPRSLSGE